MKELEASRQYQSKGYAVTEKGGKGKEKGIHYPNCKSKNPVDRSCLRLVTFRHAGQFLLLNKKTNPNIASTPPTKKKKQDLYNYRKGSNLRKINFYLKQPSPEKKTMKVAAGGEEIANKRVKVARSPSAATATWSTPRCTLRKYRLYYHRPTVQLPELCL